MQSSVIQKEIDPNEQASIWSVGGLAEPLQVTNPGYPFRIQTSRSTFPPSKFKSPSLFCRITRLFSIARTGAGISVQRLTWGIAVKVAPSEGFVESEDTTDVAPEFLAEFSEYVPDERAETTLLMTWQPSCQPGLSLDGKGRGMILTRDTIPCLHALSSIFPNVCKRTWPCICGPPTREDIKEGSESITIRPKFPDPKSSVVGDDTMSRILKQVQIS